LKTYAIPKKEKLRKEETIQNLISITQEEIESDQLSKFGDFEMIRDYIIINFLIHWDQARIIQEDYIRKNIVDQDLMESLPLTSREDDQFSECWNRLMERQHIVIAAK